MALDRVRSFMAVQYADPGLWPEAYRDAVASGDVEGVGRAFMEGLGAAGLSPEDAYIVLHEGEGASTGETVMEEGPDGEFRPVGDGSHYHMAVRFPNRVTVRKVSKATGIPEVLVQGPTSGRNSFNNMLSYLIHFKEDPDERRVYPPESVVTLAGEDYMSVYARNVGIWSRGAARKSLRRCSESGPNGSERLRELLFGIASGELTKEAICRDRFGMAVTYAMNRSKVDNMFEAVRFGEESVVRAMREVFADERYRKVLVYIYGEGGSGKSQCVSRIVEGVVEKTRGLFGVPWRLGRGSVSNPFDEYVDEEMYRIDDIRDDTMDVNEFTRVFDPEMNNPASARFHNRFFTAKVIFLTTSQDPETFFSEMVRRSGREDNTTQLFRRLGIVMKSFRVKDFSEVVLTDPSSGLSLPAGSSIDPGTGVIVPESEPVVDIDIVGDGNVVGDVNVSRIYNIVNSQLVVVPEEALRLGMSKSELLRVIPKNFLIEETPYNSDGWSSSAFPPGLLGDVRLGDELNGSELISTDEAVARILSVIDRKLLYPMNRDGRVVDLRAELLRSNRVAVEDILGTD